MDRGPKGAAASALLHPILPPVVLHALLQTLPINRHPLTSRLWSKRQQSMSARAASRSSSSADLPLYLIAMSSVYGKINMMGNMEKSELSGEDACFVANYKSTHVAGVADGVGGWVSTILSNLTYIRSAYHHHYFRRGITSTHRSSHQR